MRAAYLYQGPGIVGVVVNPAFSMVKPPEIFVLSYQMFYAEAEQCQTLLQENEYSSTTRG